MLKLDNPRTKNLLKQNFFFETEIWAEKVD